ncbi:MAG: prolyl oligopeptidase family serine peptidase [Verrucomicrobia bacterium]|nr:prolyl oligopeptidase family serine peptidase [Verrucomicrobiota bacterium]
MKFPRPGWFAASFCAAAGLRAAAPSLEERAELLFRPMLGDTVALAPDGQRLAFTTPVGRDLAIVILGLEPPGARRTVLIDGDRSSSDSNATPPLRLRFLRWATASRLIYAPVERVVPLPPLADKSGRTSPNPDGPTVVAPIFATDADGKQRGTLVDAPDFQETPDDARQSLGDLLRSPLELAARTRGPVRWRMPHVDVLGFLPRDREQLIIGTHGAYSPPRQHVVDIRTGQVRDFGDGWPAPPGEPHVFDWFRLKTVGEHRAAARPAIAWHDDELARLQRELAAKFPRRTVELLDWTDTRARVVFRVTGGSDPGRIFLYQRPEDLVLEVFRRAPWLAAAGLHETRFFEFAAPDGAVLSGYFTWPNRPRAAAPPLLVMFPTGFPGCAQPAFDPEAQLLADGGYAVARLNHRCVAGVRPEDLARLRTHGDRVAVDDARAVLEQLAAWHPGRAFDRGQIAALGHGFGGYLALRALQLAPAAFRCGVALDAPADLHTWLHPSAPAGARAIPAALTDHPETDWKKFSVLAHAGALTQPVLLLVEPARDPAIEAAADELRSHLLRLGRTPEHAPLPAGFAAARPGARAAAYRRITAFLEVRFPAATAANKGDE